MWRIDELIKSKTITPKEALIFYEELARDIESTYGTTDPEELRKLARESDNLWLEEAARDMEIYRALKKKTKN